jgi:hypothetical protein
VPRGFERRNAPPSIAYPLWLLLKHHKYIMSINRGSSCKMSDSSTPACQISLVTTIACCRNLHCSRQWAEPSFLVCERSHISLMLQGLRTMQVKNLPPVPSLLASAHTSASCCRVCGPCGSRTCRQHARCHLAPRQLAAAISTAADGEHNLPSLFASAHTSASCCKACGPCRSRTCRRSPRIAAPELPNLTSCTCAQWPLHPRAGSDQNAIVRTRAAPQPPYPRLNDDRSCSGQQIDHPQPARLA